MTTPNTTPAGGSNKQRTRWVQNGIALLVVGAVIVIAISASVVLSAHRSTTSTPPASHTASLGVLQAAYSADGAQGVADQWVPAYNRAVCERTPDAVQQAVYGNVSAETGLALLNDAVGSNSCSNPLVVTSATNVWVGEYPIPHVSIFVGQKTGPTKLVDFTFVPGSNGQPDRWLLVSLSRR